MAGRRAACYCRSCFPRLSRHPARCEDPMMTFEYAEASDNAKARRNEQRVRRGFWPKVQRVAAELPFAEDLLAAYYCAFDRNTPRHVQMVLLGALAYFVL